MIPFAVGTKDITSAHLELYQRVVWVVDALPDGLTCHQVCEHISKEIPQLRWVKGYFLNRGLRHSWLEVVGSETIIDPYPWAGAIPLIVTRTGTVNPWRQLYVEAEPRMPTDEELGL